MVKDYLEFRQKIDAKNYATLCRFCLEKSIKKKSAAVATTKVSNLFKTFMDIDFNLSLRHPYTFCETCINALEASMKFREHLRRVETFWNQYIVEMETIKTKNDSIDRISCNDTVKRKNVSIEYENVNFLIEYVNDLNTDPKPTATTSETSIVVEPLPEAEHIDLPDFIEYFEDCDNDHFDEMPEIAFVSTSTTTTPTDAIEASSPPRKKAKLVSPLATPKPKTTTKTQERKADESNSPLPIETSTKTTIARYNSEVDEDGEYIDEPKFELVEKKSCNNREHGIAVKCTKCNKEFKSKCGFAKHKRLDHPKGYVKWVNILDPRILHPDIPIICKICGKHVNTINKLCGHQRKDHKNMYHFECYICHRTYAAKKALQMHFYSIHNVGDKEFITLCHICGVIISPHNFDRHLKTTHRNGKIGKIKPSPDFITQTSKCIYCPTLVEFKYKKELKEHIKKVHSSLSASNRDESNYRRCDICCSYFTIQTLDLHYRKHSNRDRPFKCSICSATFTREPHLKGHHLRKHTTVRAHKCDKCDKAFAQMYELRSHQRIVHLKMKPYECTHCKRAFSTTGQLKHHLKTLPCMSKLKKWENEME